MVVDLSVHWLFRRQVDLFFRNKFAKKLHELKLMLEQSEPVDKLPTSENGLSLLVQPAQQEGGHPASFPLPGGHPGGRDRHVVG